ncbi:hypothetical protein [Haliangium sp.]|uniref:hypothetical protein n=1 Tax=Haliangium sp. TaxID=2663208 RepID=UPI003D1111D2
MRPAHTPSNVARDLRRDDDSAAPSARDRVAEAVAEIAVDAVEGAEAYLRETVVPEGGE